MRKKSNDEKSNDEKSSKPKELVELHKATSKRSEKFRKRLAGKEEEESEDN